jgi:hypothetical protein
MQEKSSASHTCLAIMGANYFKAVFEFSKYFLTFLLSKYKKKKISHEFKQKINTFMKIRMRFYNGFDYIVSGQGKINIAV